EQRIEKAAALSVDLIAFGRERSAEISRIAPARVSLREERQHERREHAQQVARVAAAQPARLPETALGALRTVAEDVPEDPLAVARATAAQHAAEDRAQVGAGVIALQCSEQRIGALRSCRVAPEGAEQHRQR